LGDGPRHPTTRVRNLTGASVPAGTRGTGRNERNGGEGLGKGRDNVTEGGRRQKGGGWKKRKGEGEKGGEEETDRKTKGSVGHKSVRKSKRGDEEKAERRISGGKQ